MVNKEFITKGTMVRSLKSLCYLLGKLGVSKLVHPNPMYSPFMVATPRPLSNNRMYRYGMPSHDAKIIVETYHHSKYKGSDSET